MISGLDVSLKTTSSSILRTQRDFSFSCSNKLFFCFSFSYEQEKNNFFLCSQGLVDALSTAFLRSHDKDDMADMRGNDSRC